MGSPFPSGEGSQGQFHTHANYASLKHALNQGERTDDVQKNTLARIYLAVSPSDRAKFFDSIGSGFVKTNLAPQLTGTTRDDTTGSNVGKGYIDFFLERVQHSLQENFQVAPTLEGNYVVYSFDQQPPTWAYSGFLLNTQQDDQAINFFRLYVHLIRLSQLAKRKLVVSIRYDSYIVHGAIVDLTLDHSSDVQMKVPFSFRLLVKKVLDVNYNINWTPTQPAGNFSDDPFSAGLGNLPVTRRRATTDVATTPVNVELAPVPSQEADPRVNDDPITGEADGEEPLASGVPAPASPGNVAAAPAAPETASPPTGRGLTVEP